MENFNEAKEVIKQAMKTELRETISTSLEKHSTELAVQIQNVVKDITDWEWKKKGFEAVRKATEKGAVGMALNSLIEKVASDAVKHASPKIEEFVNVIRTIIAEATGEAISELIKEELKKQGYKKNGKA